MTPSAPTWPILDNAVRWLLGEQILSRRDVATMEAAAELDARFYVDTLFASIHDRVLREAAESVAAGEGRDAWRERLGAVVQTTDAQAEAVGRTLAHQSMRRGLDEVLANPSVGDRFPFLLWLATRDTRVRPSHEALDGKVAYRTSPLADTMRQRHDDWNCRCTLVPLSRKDAERRGIDDDTGDPGEPEKKSDDGA